MLEAGACEGGGGGESGVQRGGGARLARYRERARRLDERDEVAD